jgi:hypothetical protein
MRPFATESSRGAGLMVDDDDALAAAITAAGGEVRFEVLVLRGPLPPV